MPSSRSKRSTIVQSSQTSDTKITRVVSTASLHADKQSREAFEIRTHKRLLDILEPTQQTADALIKLDLPAGVEAKIATPAPLKGRHLIQQLATEVWGNKEAAARWLNAPHMELDGKAPQSLLNTAPGIRRVENLLSALENGFPV